MKTISQYFFIQTQENNKIINPYTLIFLEDTIESTYQQNKFGNVIFKMRMSQLFFMIIQMFQMVYFHQQENYLELVVLHGFMITIIPILFCLDNHCFGIKNEFKLWDIAIISQQSIIQIAYFYCFNTKYREINVDILIFILLNFMNSIENVYYFLSKLTISIIFLPLFIDIHIKQIEQIQLFLNYFILIIITLMVYNRQRYEKLQYFEQFQIQNNLVEQVILCEECIDNQLIILQQNTMSKNCSKQLSSNRVDDISILLNEYDYEILYRNKQSIAACDEESQLMNNLNQIKLINQTQDTIPLHSIIQEHIAKLRVRTMNSLKGYQILSPLIVHQAIIDNNPQLIEIKIGLCNWNYRSGVLLIIRNCIPPLQMTQKKSHLFSSVSHELKTPLNGMYLMVQSSIQIIKNDFIKSDRSKEILVILMDVQHNNYILQSKINDLLDYKRIESGNLDLSRVEFDVTNTLDDLRDLFLNQFKSKQVQFHIDNQLTNPLFYTDESRLKQILINLIGNALKFTFQGSVTLSVKEKQNKLIQFQIADTGIGIPLDLQRKLFHLTEEHNPTHGAGLGLTISRMLVGQLGPQEILEVHSIPNEGTTFSFRIFSKLFNHRESQQFYVPSEIRGRRKIQSIRIQHSEKFVNSLSQKKIQQEQLKILIVDDTSINIIALKGLLYRIIKTRSHKIDEAYNGVQSVEMVQKVEYDLIFMDINMPIMDGLEATKIIREIENLQNRKNSIIAIVTAYSDVESKKTSKQYGANYHVIKPIMRQILWEILSENFNLL